MDAHGVRVEAEAAADVAIDVSVGVDQAGQHQLAADVDRLADGAREAPAHRGNPTIAHRHIENAVETLRRIDDAAAPKQQIERRGLHDIHVGALAGWPYSVGRAPPGQGLTTAREQMVGWRDGSDDDRAASRRDRPWPAF